MGHSFSYRLCDGCLENFFSSGCLREMIMEKKKSAIWEQLSLSFHTLRSEMSTALCQREPSPGLEMQRQEPSRFPFNPSEFRAGARLPSTESAENHQWILASHVNSHVHMVLQISLSESLFIFPSSFSAIPTSFVVFMFWVFLLEPYFFLHSRLFKCCFFV